MWWSSAAAMSRSTRLGLLSGRHLPVPRRLRRLRSARRPNDDARRAMTTTLDVARAARRAGVLDVTIVALESAEEIPADPEEIDEAEREGIRIVYRRGPHRFVGDTKVTGLETIAVSSVFDAEGRFSPTFEPGTEAVIAADTVILAVGQGADVSFLDADVELERTRAGGVQVDPDSLRTSDPRIWAGGDVAHGPRNLIDAIADGRRAAASIHGALTGVVRARDLDARGSCRAAHRLPSARQRLRRDSAPTDPGHTDRPAGRLRRGRDRLRRAPGPSRRAAVPALLRQRHALARVVHPLRSLRRRVPAQLHHHRARRSRRARERAAVGAAARRGSLHPLRIVRQSLPAGRTVDGSRTGAHS